MGVLPVTIAAALARLARADSVPVVASWPVAPCKRSACGGEIDRRRVRLIDARSKPLQAGGRGVYPPDDPVTDVLAVMRAGQTLELDNAMRGI